jgi:hypothetical protein
MLDHRPQAREARYALEGGDGKTATATCATPCDFYRNGWAQVTGNSDPALNGTFTVTTTTSTSFSYASTSTATGTGGTVINPDYLPISVPFAVSQHATALEIYLCDLLYAFDPDPVLGLTCSRHRDRIRHVTPRRLRQRTASERHER